MVEEPIAFLRACARPAARSEYWGGEAGLRGDEQRFDRRELAQILRVYGRMVAAGEWRDYAIDFLSDRAVFRYFVTRATCRSTPSRNSQSSGPAKVSMWF